jgi:hypothetical protein
VELLAVLVIASLAWAATRKSSGTGPGEQPDPYAGGGVNDYGGGMNLMQAMARMEGFGVKGTRPTRNNNPGDIEYGSFAKAHGATGTDGRFAIFPDAQTGFGAMRALLTAHYSGLSLSEALNKWAPPLENNTNRYIASVMEWTGLGSGDTVTPANIG